ncbi:MAG TPA: AMP-binding protein [Candidatus Binatia bacterium]|nr:AMP-binding protein [Candidatus Binatia bacterium]
MSLHWLFEIFRQYGSHECVIWRDQSITYDELLERTRQSRSFLAECKVQPGEAILLDADYSPGSIALLLASIENRNIVVPLAAHVKSDREKFAEISEASWHLKVLPDDTYEARSYSREMKHPLSLRLKSEGSAGLILFSSGSTGEPKASLHNIDFLLAKYRVQRRSQRIVAFLLFDHIGGFNTLLHTLSNHGCLIALAARDAVSVCQAIERHRVEVLPTSPTFLNLLLMSEAWRDHDLSSLELITYGTESMPEMTLRKLNQVFPRVRFAQTYGLSELGILRSKSRTSDSLWVKVGGEDYETRVVDGILHVRAKSSMLGYLNAPCPFDEDGWFNTQDEVEVDGEWLRFKGRKSDIINVGGEKVYPADVESVILEVDNVIDAAVSKERHPITGNIVVATVAVRKPEPQRDLARRIQAYCFKRLPRYKIPVKVYLAESTRMTERFKKQR